MADDWQVGDKAVMVRAGPFECARCYHGGQGCPPVGSVNQVVAVRVAIIEEGAGAGTPCGCLELRFSGGLCGVAQRFRKIRPDEHIACEDEFTVLLKRNRVSA